MGYDVLTVDGDFFSGGFFSSDTSRIRLGELPVMTADQFNRFVGQVILEFLPGLSVEQQNEVSDIIAFTKEKMDGLPVRTIESPYSEAVSVDETTTGFIEGIDNKDGIKVALAGEGLAMAIGSSLGNVSTYYASNPFILRDNRVVIGGTYEVEPLEFTHFALTYLGGGALGWSRQLGVPESAVKSIQELDEALGSASK